MPRSTYVYAVGVEVGLCADDSAEQLLFSEPRGKGVLLPRPCWREAVLREDVGGLVRDRGCGGRTVGEADGCLRLGCPAGAVFVGGPGEVDELVCVGQEPVGRDTGTLAGCPQRSRAAGGKGFVLGDLGL